MVASEDFIHAHKLGDQVVESIAYVLETDDPATFDLESASELAGYDMTKRCPDKAFAQARFAPGQGRDEVNVVELLAPAEVGVAPATF